ncbi:MAG TPA: sigma 54-interacting transcriptional regulator, partial [Acidobacteriota bacterium]|nr:sigma 54-interacting transcriptional regulator [Acidobacteriota bacterium]
MQITDRGRYRIRHPLEKGPELRLFALQEGEYEGDPHDPRDAPESAKMQDAESNRAGEWKALALHLLEEDLSRPSHRRRIERLWDLRGRLDHPALPPLIDLYWRGRRAGLVVPDLQQQDGFIPYPFDAPLEQRLSDALQLAQLSVYLHRRGFLCGLFPAVKLWRSREGVLLNVIELQRPRDEDELPAAKVRYAAPEFLQGREPDVPSDLYSLGLLLYHVLTGSPPFLEDDLDSLRQKQMMAVPADPRQIEPSLPQEALQMLAALTQKDRSLRPSSADFAVTALRSACSSRGLSSCGEMRTPAVRSGLVGRKKERQRLEQCLDRYLKDGQPRVLVVRGAAGIGKSRLLERLRLLGRLRRIECLSVAGGAGKNQDASALPLQPPARDAAQPSPAPQDAEADAPSDGLGNRVPRLWRFLLDLPHPQVVLCGSPPPAEVIEALLSEEGEAHGPLLAFEMRLGQGQSFPRPRKGVEVLDVGPLSSAESETLVRQALGRPLQPRPLRRVLSQGGGTPLFLIESLRQMVSSGELRFQGGRWRRDPSVPPSDVPPASLKQSLLHQYRQLDPFPARVMQALAVAGEPLTLSVLSQVVDASIQRCEDALRLLRACQLARPSGSLSQARASLHHSWGGPVVAAALKDETRREIHDKLAQSYRARLCPHSPACERAEALKHSLRAGDSRQVDRLLWPAVEALQEESLLSQAARLLEEAVSSGLLQEPRWKLRLRLAQLHFRCGELEQCLEIGQGLLEHPQLARPVRRARLQALLARAGLLRGEGSTAIQRLEDALQRLDGGGPVGLDNEVRGELLAALAYRGRRREARPLARHLMREIKERRRHAAFDKVCHALFLYFHMLRGESRKGVTWEVRSIRLAFEAGLEERALGRLLSLALLQAEQGRTSRSQAILRYVRPLPALRRHAEAELFARLAECLILRRQGRYREALVRLSELKAQNRRANRSRNLGSALYIELARNFNRLLQPQKALENLARSRRLLQREDKFEDVLDTLAEEARAWLVLGRPQRAALVLERPECSLPSPRRIDFQLLQARVALLEGRPQDAAPRAQSVLEEAASDDSPWGVEAAMIAARTCLLSDDPAGARELARQALEMARNLADDPLQAESLQLLSRCQLADGDARMAVLLARRGLQICDRLQSPALRAGLLRRLGRALARQASTDQALRCFSQALQVLKEALFHLSTAQRRAFSRFHLEPLEEERSQVLQSHNRPEEGRHLVQMRRWMAALDTASEPRSWADLLLQSVCTCIPAAGRVYLSPQAGGEPIPIASRGECRHDGRALLGDPSSPAFDTLRWRDQGVLSRLGIPLSHPARGEGLLYLECPRQAVSETEIDYLLCLTSCLELHWERETAGPPPDQRASRTLAPGGAAEIIGRHPSMAKLMEQVRRIAPTSATVLISGESGTGKELVARALHHGSRRSGAFVAVNCSGLPESLIESELFGHAKGAFTGASQDKRGLFEAASGGTLFLDEIASMPAGLQQSLLRALQEGRIRRVGETRERGVNVRILSASNQPLRQLVSEGKFRSDLYHRLNVCHLQIPPLRDRRGDIPLLAKHRLNRLRQEEGRNVRFSPQALQLLSSYHFPGNVRELHNLVESAFFLAQKRIIQADDLRPRMEQPSSSRPFGRHRQILEQMLSGDRDFWQAVRGPFLERDLSRHDVRRVISLGLGESQGSYRKLTALFNLPAEDYKRFMSFLAHHDCKVDFRPYRRT